MRGVVKIFIMDNNYDAYIYIYYFIIIIFFFNKSVMKIRLNRLFINDEKE